MYTEVEGVLYFAGDDVVIKLSGDGERLARIRNIYDDSIFFVDDDGTVHAWASDQPDWIDVERFRKASVREILATYPKDEVSFYRQALVEACEAHEGLGEFVSSWIEAQLNGSVEKFSEKHPGWEERLEACEAVMEMEQLDHPIAWLLLGL